MIDEFTPRARSRRGLATLLSVALVAALTMVAAASPATAAQPDGASVFYLVHDQSQSHGPQLDLHETDSSVLDAHDDAAAVALPFEFTFYGTPYSSITVSRDGGIAFGSGDAAAFGIDPAGQDVDVALALGTDWEGGEVRTGVSGPSGEQVFVVEWSGVQPAGSGTPATFQLQLVEVTDAIEVHVADGIDPAVTSDAVTGIGGPSGPAVLHAGTGAGSAVRFSPVPDPGFVPTTASQTADGIAAAAATITVTTLLDVVSAADGLVSLREAITTANTNGEATTINLMADGVHLLDLCAPGNVSGVDENANAHGDLDHVGGDDLIIQGNGATIFNTCLGERVIHQVSSASSILELRDVKITGGRTRFGNGGGIFIDQGTLTLDGVSIRDNFILGEIPDGGGSDNPRGGAGIYVREANLFISDSSFRQNVTFNDALQSVFGTGLAIQMRQSNQATTATTTEITNTTFTNNQSAQGSAIFVAGSFGIIDLNHVSVLSNSTSLATSADVARQFGVLTARNTVIGDSVGAGGDCLLGGQTVSGGYNFSSDGSCFLQDPTDIVGGGATQTLAVQTDFTDYHIPDAMSALRDAIPLASCSLPTDQLGNPRPDGALCDIGAIEGGETAPPIEAAQFVPLPPVRLFDTRPNTAGVAGPKGLVGSGQTIDVQITGVAGVPANATAVVMNVTATEAVLPGFITAFPAGSPRPTASNLNLTAPGQTRANLVTVPIGAAGKVSLFSSGGAHLLADVAGYYVDVTEPQSAGRVISTNPTRLFDTRSPGPLTGIVGTGETITVPVAGLAGVPATGAQAVVMNVTATAAVAQGFVTVYPSTSTRPTASVLNLNAPGETAPNLVIVPLGTDGAVKIFTSGGTHLLADVTGYVTDSTAPAETTGLFVPLDPARVLDTRSATEPGPTGFVGSGQTITVDTGGTTGIPEDAGGVVLNVTGTAAAADGFVTVFPTGTSRPTASTLNLVTGDTRANAAILALGTNGDLDYFSFPGTHLVADTAGYYLG